MEAVGYSDPEGNPHASTDWEIWRTAATERVWSALAVTDPFLRVHIHLGDGAFEGSYAGRAQLEFDTDYTLRVRFRDSNGEASAWAERAFRTSPEGPAGVPGPMPWVALQPGYTVEVVATGFQLPVNIAFVPNPGPNPADPFLYVTELYGTIKVVLRDGTVANYATDLLNFDPTGAFPGSGEQGLTGIVVDPATGNVYASLLYEDTASAQSPKPHYPKVVRFTSTDGGRTAATQTTILDMFGEPQGQSHQISNLTIGPDGKVYVHMGDGFNAASALDLNSFRGKILRANLEGTAPADNPFYNGAPITARDYVFAYGVRNPFGGAWRAADGAHYEVENGPSVDRFAKVVAGRNFGWNGTDASMSNFAIYNWNPAHAPVNLAYVQPETFAGSGFPAEKMDRAYVSESGPTYALGPQALGKRIVEFALDTAGNLAGGPTTLIEYNGTGRATAAGLAAGPDGLYFTDLYKDEGAVAPTDHGANLLRVRFTGAPPPGSGSGLTAQYFDNIDLTNLKVLRTDATVNFAWGTGSPDPAIASNTFSARWQGQVEAPASETFTFYTLSDDGVRLWVNGVLVVNNWTDHAATENSGSIALTAGQKYDLRLEFYENGGDATITLSWSGPTTPKQIVPQSRLYPSASVVSAPVITPNGGTFTGSVSVTLATSTSGAFIRYTTNGTTPTSTVGTLYAGAFTLSASATVKAIAYKTGMTDSSVSSAVFTVSDDVATGSGLTGQYYNDPGTGAHFGTLVLTRTDATVNFNWGSGSPGTGVQTDNFSVRWTGQVLAPVTGNYTLSTVSDDGVRLWVNGQLVINNWTNHAPTTNTSAAIALAAGVKYAITMEFYERGGGAVAQLRWAHPGQAQTVVPQSRLFPASASPNQAPTVNAGPDQTIALPASANLAGSASDDGQPNPLTTTWSKLSGPGTVTFGNANALSTSASFSTSGSYALRLTASDGVLTSADDVVVTVNAAPGGTGTGLTGQYYNDPGTGARFVTLVLTRTDPTVNFNWGTGSPGPGVTAERFSVRWTGQVLAPVTGNYIFSTVSDDGVRLWVNGQLVINNWTNHAATTNNSAPIALSAGTKYAIRMEFYEQTSAALARLLWAYPGQAQTVIPQSRLFP